MRRYMRIELLMAIALGLVLLSTEESFAQGCSMCRTAVGGEEDPLARGFYRSILFLMAAPYTVMGSIGGWLGYRYWKTSRDSSAAGRTSE